MYFIWSRHCKDGQNKKNMQVLINTRSKLNVAAVEWDESHSDGCKPPARMHIIDESWAVQQPGWWFQPTPLKNMT